MNQMKIFITAPSQALPQLGIPGCRVAHMDYSIGPGKRLMRNSRSRAFRGGLLVLPGRNIPSGNSSLLIGELTRECQLRGYGGVVAGFDEVDPMLPALSSRLTARGQRLYLPQELAEDIPDSMALCATAISGGSLKARLEELCQKLGPERIALDIQRIRMDFLLPSPEGQGQAISRDELAGLLSSRGGQYFFSADLCACYFTYSENGRHHFVLFDTAASIMKKLSIAQQLGIGEAFLLYSEVQDILPEMELQGR